MTLRTAILLLALFGLAPAAYAGDPPPPEARLYSLADFPDLRPRTDQNRLYPKRARNEGLQGTVVLNCQVGDEQNYTRCAIVSEAPPGYGFGEASIAWLFSNLASLQPAGSWIRLTVMWKL